MAYFGDDDVKKWTIGAAVTNKTDGRHTTHHRESGCTCSDDYDVLCSSTDTAEKNQIGWDTGQRVLSKRTRR